MVDLSNIDYKTGNVRYLTSGSYEEDILQVDYPHQFVLDLGWDIRTMKKAFAGTDFTHKKGNPGWLGEYDCRNSHGHLYRAYIQKLSDGCTFRVWLEISGYNFETWRLAELDYCMREEGESMPILREFALLCAKIRDEYGEKLAADFGDTPEWYYKL